MPGKTKNTRHYHPFLALFTGLVSVIGCLIFFAFALAHWELSQHMMTAMVLSSISIGSAVGGGLMARLRGSGGLICGFITGIAYSAILLLWSFLCNGSILSVPLLYFGCIFLFGCAGGYCGMLLAEEHSKRHR